MRTEAGDRINHAIADNIKRLRLERGLSQEELAQRMGIKNYKTTGKTTVSRMERGDTYFIVEKLIPLAIALGVPFNELFRGVDEYADIFDVSLSTGLTLRTMLTEEEMECLTLFRALGVMRKFRALTYLRDQVELEEAHLKKDD